MLAAGEVAGSTVFFLGVSAGYWQAIIDDGMQTGMIESRWQNKPYSDGSGKIVNVAGRPTRKLYRLTNSAAAREWLIDRLAIYR